MVKWIRILYLIVAWLFPGAMLVQALFVGLSLFTAQAERSFPYERTTHHHSRTGARA
jgi:hypothetical protein